MVVTTLTLLYLLFGVGGGDTQTTIERMDALVQEIVLDKKRMKQARSVLKEMKKESKRFQKELSGIRGKLLSIDAKHDASLNEYRAVFKEADEAWFRTEKTLIELRFRMKDHMTRPEWRALFAGLENEPAGAAR